jgi:hypothetical protein
MKSPFHHEKFISGRNNTFTLKKKFQASQGEKFRVGVKAERTGS